MLILTRKVGESIRIDDNITITIVRIQGNRVRVGIDAPKDVRIVRSEMPPQPPRVIPFTPQRPLSPLSSYFPASTPATA